MVSGPAPEGMKGVVQPPWLRSLGLAGVLAALISAIAVSGCSGDDNGNGNGAESAQATPAVKVPQTADAFENQLVRVVRAVSPAVVQIQARSGLGSGVVYDRRGNVVTNAHVVGNSRRFVVTLEDGDQHPATLVGSFPANDLAVIRLQGATPRPASFANSSRIQVGEVALAIGNPLGLRSSVTEGIVSSIGRTVNAGGGVVLPSVIQTSAPINPGNSGGALVDISGRVIGIPTLAALVPELGGSAAPGIGFAIPSNTVRRIADQLIQHGRVLRSGRAYLGVRASTITGGGVLVSTVERGGPAARAGIRPGDIVTAVAGKPTPTTDVLASVLATLRPGRRVSVTILRPGGRRVDITVTLGELRGG